MFADHSLPTTGVKSYVGDMGKSTKRGDPVLKNTLMVDAEPRPFDLLY
jgi:hypothetical protein